MYKGKMDGFIVDTGSNCFLCLGQLQESTSSSFKTESKFGSKNQSDNVTIRSLQFISRYLMMDTSKLFQEDLLSKVEGTKLNVRLCAACSSIHDSFSKAYRELEKIEMELAFSLKLILTRLDKAVEREKAEDLHSLTELVEKFNRSGKLQIAEALRRETIRKCSRKLRILLPRIPMKNMTRAQVNNEKLKIKRSWRQEMLATSRIETNFENTYQKTEINCQPTAGPISPAPVMDNRPMDDMDDLHDSSYAAQMDGGADDEGSPKLQQVMKYETNDNDESKEINAPSDGIKNTTPLLASLLSILPPPPSETFGPAQAKLEPGMNPVTQISQFNTGNSRGPLRDTRWLAKVPKGSVDPETGRILCGLCQKLFLTVGGYHGHYKSTHLQVRYKCPDPDCDKQFVARDTSLMHHRSVHMQIKNYKCPKCFKLFADRSNCRKHLRNIHTNPHSNKTANSKRESNGNSRV